MPQRNPYPGLRPFEQRDSRVFFGRDDQIDALLDRLDRDRFLAVVGSSASGKSSLVRAGLFPALYGGHLGAAGSRWRVVVLRPGGAAIAALAGALDEGGVLGDGASEHERIGLARAVLEEGELGLIEIVREARLPADENVLIVVDQFEELFRFRHDRDDAPAFVKLLLAATARREIPVYVLITMRSDFLGDTSQFRDLPEAISNGLFLVPRLTRDQLREVIEAPAAIAGGEIASVLVNQLLNELGDSPDQLPVLQHALMRTWDIAHAAGRADEPIGLSEFAATGGLARAMSNHGDDVYDALPPHAGLAAQHVFRALTDRTSDERGIRRPSSLSELCAVTGASREDVVSVIEAFRAPGISFIVPAANVPLTGDTIVDISHESLMRVWTRLSQWVDDEARSARIYRRIADGADQYERGVGPLIIDPALTIDLAWRSENLPTAAWADRYVPGSYERTMRFLERSAEERDRAAALAGSARRRRALTATGFSFVLVLTLLSIGALLLLQHQRGAIFALQSKGLARDAQAAIDRGDPVTGALIALAALPQSVANPDRPYTREARDALAHAYASIRELRDLTGHTSVIYRIAFSPDGRRLVAPSADGTARIWDVASGKLLHVIYGPDKTYMPGAGWSPDGRRLITTSGNGTAQTYDATTYRKLAFFGTETNYITTAVISRDERYLLTSSFDGTARIWNASTGTLLRVLHGKEDSILWCAGFSPDGRTVATASGDGFARIWDARTGRQLRVAEFDGSVNWIAYAPDGKRVVLALEDKTVRIFSAPALQQRLVMHRDDYIAYSAAFSHDGRRIVIGSHDTNAEVRDAATGALSFVLGGANGQVWESEFSPDDRLIATGSGDGVARLWDARPRPPRLTVRASRTGGANAAAYFSDGKKFVTAGHDGVVRVWDALNGKELQQLHGCAASVRGVAVSTDGSRIAGVCDTVAIEWNVGNGRSLHVFRGHRGPVTSIAFTSDGRRIVTGSDDATVRVWDAISGAPLKTLTGHKFQVFSVAASHDGRSIAAGANDATTIVWDARTWAVRRVLEQPDSGIFGVAFSPDDSRIVTASDDNKAREWDVKTGAAIAVFKGDADIVRSASFSPDGSRVVTASDDGTVRLWDAIGGASLLSLRDGDAYVKTAAFSRDGREVLAASTDGNARVWRLPDVPECQHLIDAMRAALPRELRADQLQEESIDSRRASPITSVFMGGESCSQ